MTTEPGQDASADDATSSPPAPGSTSELLQSMLSRAVEGQVDEQRELAGAIDDMRSQLMRVGHDIADLRSRSPREEVSDAQVNAVTNELREAVRFLNERIDGVTRMLALRGEEFADVRTVLAALDATLRTQAETLAQLGEEMAQLPVYDERLSHLQTELGAMHSQVRETHAVASAAPTQAAIEAAVQAAVLAAVAPLAEQLAAVSDTTAARSESTSADLEQIKADLASLGESGGADDGLRDYVTASVQETERRLATHIDEAVLALAEALLRRRISTPRATSDGGESAAAPVEELSDPPAAATEEPAVEEWGAEEPVAETPYAEPAPEAEPAAAESSYIEPDAEAEPAPDGEQPEAEQLEAEVSYAEPEPEVAEAESADPDAELRPPVDPVQAEDEPGDDSPAVLTSAPEPPPYFATTEPDGLDLATSDDESAIAGDDEPPAVWWEQEIGTITPPPDAAGDDSVDVGWVAVPAADSDDSTDAEVATEDPEAVTPDWTDDAFTTTEIPPVPDADPAEPAPAEHTEVYAPSTQWSPEPPPDRAPSAREPGTDEPKRRRRWF